MTSAEKRSTRPTKEQIIYANLLLMGMIAGIIVMTVTYVIYLSGLLPAHVSMDIVSANWGKGVHEYMEITQSPNGWGWLGLLGRGDFLNFIGFALLGLMTIICFLVLVRGYLRKKDWIFATISVLEIVVLALAASGIFGSGGH
jgi:hypothetical protein